MELINRGDIFLTSVSLNGQQESIRPVLVIQNDLLNKYAKTVLVAPISSNVNLSNIRSHVSLSMEHSKLRLNTIVLLEQTTVINKNSLKEKISNVGEQVLGEVDRALIFTNGVELSIEQIEKEGNQNHNITFLEENDFAKNMREFYSKFDLVDKMYLEFSESISPKNKIKDWVYSGIISAFIGSTFGAILAAYILHVLKIQ